MNLDDTVSGLEEQRLRYVNHKGKAILVIDCSRCTSKEMIVLLDQVRATITRQKPGSVLAMADLSGAQFDKAVATKIKETLVFDRPFVKRSAWVGTETLPHVFYEHFKSFSQRDIPLFKTREEAMDWLVGE
jgi:hypothetical protein